jgi:hypothetical protein
MLIRTTASEDARKITRYVIVLCCNCIMLYLYHELEFSNAYYRPTAQPMVTVHPTHSRMVPPMFSRTPSMMLLLGLLSADSDPLPWISDVNNTFTFNNKSIRGAAVACEFVSYIVT